MAREDPEEIEAEVMAEIRRALQQPPPKTIRIPKGAKSPPQLEGCSFDTSEPDSLEEEGREALVRVKDHDGNSPKKKKKKKKSPFSIDGSELDDSLILQLACMSSVGGSSGAGSENSQRFYIGSIQEGEEGSIPSRVGDEDEEDMSKGELMDAVERLYAQLQKSDDALVKERQRRKSREKSLIKMAKELARCKETARKHLSRVAELQDEMAQLVAQRTQLQEEADSQIREDESRRAQARRENDLEVEDIRKKYVRALAAHDRRISEMSKTHAKQCEQLCREVVDANRESLRLQQKLSELSYGTGHSSDAPVFVRSRSARTGKSRRAKRARASLAVLAVLVLAAAAYGLRFLPPGFWRSLWKDDSHHAAPRPAVHELKKTTISSGSRSRLSGPSKPPVVMSSGRKPLLSSSSSAAAEARKIPALQPTLPVPTVSAREPELRPLVSRDERMPVAVVDPTPSPASESFAPTTRKGLLFRLRWLLRGLASILRAATSIHAMD